MTARENRPKASGPFAREGLPKWLYPLYEQLESARTGRQAAGVGSKTPSLKNELVRKIVVFLKEIGLEVISTNISCETFLPGILVDQGKLLIDENRLLWPGDLLHEAGHLAVVPARLRSTLSW